MTSTCNTYMISGLCAKEAVIVYDKNVVNAYVLFENSSDVNLAVRRSPYIIPTGAHSRVIQIHHYTGSMPVPSANSTSAPTPNSD